MSAEKGSNNIPVTEHSEVKLKLGLTTIFKSIKNNETFQNTTSKVVDAFPESIKENIQEVANKVSESTKPYKEKVDDFMSNHGGKVADVLTGARIVFGAATVLFLLNDNRKLAQEAYVAAEITDPFDGEAARWQYPLGRETGGKFDTIADKLVTAGVEIAEAYKGRIKPEHAILRIGRDVGMTIFRKPYEDAGISVQATWPGKGGMIFTAFGEGVALTNLPDSHPKINDAIQWLGTGAKLTSAGKILYDLEKARRGKVKEEQAKEAA